MTYLCDRDLRELCLNHRLVEPFDPACLNSASIDLKVGRGYIREEAVRLEMPDEGIEIEPGECVLIDVLERVTIPNGHAADLRLKSTSGRLRLQHSLAGWIDPGYGGILTLEVSNIRRWSMIRLRPGERIVQLLVSRTSGPSDSPYGGRYQDARGVEDAKP